MRLIDTRVEYFLGRDKFILIGHDWGAGKRQYYKMLLDNSDDL